LAVAGQGLIVPVLSTAASNTALIAAHNREGRTEMKGDPKVIERLNQALFLELGAVNQYWVHYRLLEDWGYQKLAKKERAESIEEMHHADRLVARIIFLEGHPNLQTLAPLRIGQNVKEVLEADLAGEYDARTAYKQSRDICHAAGDYVSMKLFEELLADEEGHIDFLETQLDLLAKIGEEKYGLLNAEPANEAE
jgi:bacterioferritin